MNNIASKVHSFLSPRNINAIRGFDAKDYPDLSRLGIGFGKNVLDEMMNKFAMDAVEPTVTTASIATPIQFLQNWLPGFVFVITAARKIDEIVGIATVGEWSDKEVVQGVLERVGSSVPYGDYTNVPLSSWNTNFERRTVVKFEEGMKVGVEEQETAARMRVDTASMKRESSALALEIVRNLVGFFGYNSGANRTYGFLNDPNLPAYVTVPVGVSTSTLWSSKTFLEICKDIRGAIVALRNQSQDTIDPSTTNLTLAVATNSVDWLSTTSDFGISVSDWLSKAYPRIRVVSAPELDLANGGANVFYLFAESVNDASTDDGRTFIQVVPQKFRVLGVQQLAKGYEEDYSNATAGIMCKRPFAVVRRSGI